MGKAINTPWKWHTDLVRVRGQLYPTNETLVSGKDERRQGVDMVRAWKKRGGLPHTVLSTALLVDAVLHDDPASVSILSISATYSFAFCRFVTGLLDSRQTGKRKKSMFTVAKELGLPASFVDLRHAATHEDIPSLINLRQACQRSLDWLWHYYWNAIDEPSVNIYDESGDLDPSVLVFKEQCRDLLRAFVKPRIEQLRTLKATKTNSGSRVLEASQNDDLICKKLVSLCKDRYASVAILSAVLLEKRFLIPSIDSAGTKMNGVFMLWDYLLKKQANHQTSFLMLLVQEMISQLKIAPPNDPALDFRRESLFQWLDHILFQDSWVKVRRKRLAEPRDWDALIYSCVQTPNRWTLKLVNMIIDGDQSSHADGTYGVHNRKSNLEEMQLGLDTQSIIAAKKEVETYKEEVTKLEKIHIPGANGD